MISKISDEVYCLEGKTFGSKVYLVNKKILIDTSSEANRGELLNDLKKLGLKLDDIKYILLTHMHFDHSGNLELFKNAKIFADINEIKAKKQELKERKIKIYSIPKTIDGIKVIKAYGHTAGSLCFLYKNILFSGDTIFDKDFTLIGRTDLPNSKPELMPKTLEKLKKVEFDILCPGH
ncbi:MAG: MBL fold metallo-hydrolase [Candidatus Pacearchaeota archaeon]